MRMLVYVYARERERVRVRVRAPGYTAIDQRAHYHHGNHHLIARDAVLRVCRCISQSTCEDYRQVELVWRFRLKVREFQCWRHAPLVSLLSRKYRRTKCAI